MGYMFGNSFMIHYSLLDLMLSYESTPAIIIIIFITYTPDTNKHTHEKNKNI